MRVINNGLLDIATGHSATSKSWTNKSINWSDLLDMLATPVYTKETMRAYKSASKTERSKIKDVGGFIGGLVVNGKRNKTSILSRSIIALDIDESSPDIWLDFQLLYGVAAVIHSTHSSTPENPRHRLLIPLTRAVSGDEYQAVARHIAADLGMEHFDSTTFDINRLMFWPSLSQDAQYYFEYIDAPWLNPDIVLDTYTDWSDMSAWPVCSKEDNRIRDDIHSQEDPLTKSGIVGLFCRAYTIQDAIAAFLPEEYTPVDSTRYTYTKGSTTAGLVIYNDKFAYSHHNTDPAGGRLCNAFDLVRLHKFGHLDKRVKADDSKSASYKAMESMALTDDKVKKQIATEKFSEAKTDFATEEWSETESDWLTELEVNKSGEYVSSAANINIILSKDPNLKNIFAFNKFDNRRYLMRTAPWRTVEAPDLFRDVDYAGVRNYLDCVFGIASNSKIDDSLSLEFEHNSFHPIQDYLKALKWDGTYRIDKLLPEYFGTDNSEYTLSVMRKTLLGAIARVFNPGIKFDTVMVLSGPQGSGKSTFIKKLGGPWFSDTFSTVQGKEAFEQLQGAWLIEIGELAALRKAEVEAIKHFITKCEDSFRPAYCRVSEVFKRQCIFIGTTNSNEFLRDSTGNRRFLPIAINTEAIHKSVFTDFTQEEVDQVWAEAYMLYKGGDSLLLEASAAVKAQEMQELYTEVDERVGLIAEFLNRPRPEDWADYDLFQRQQWLDDPLAKAGKNPVNEVCTLEIWCECLGKKRSELSRAASKELNSSLKRLKGWSYSTKMKRFPIYGIQRYFYRDDNK